MRCNGWVGGFFATLVLAGLSVAGAAPAAADDVVCPGQIPEATFELTGDEVGLGGKRVLPAASKADSQLVVLGSYNIGGSNCTKCQIEAKVKNLTWKDRRAKIMSNIKRSNATVVALQEVYGSFRADARSRMKKLGYAEVRPELQYSKAVREGLGKKNPHMSDNSRIYYDSKTYELKDSGFFREKKLASTEVDGNSVRLFGNWAAGSDGYAVEKIYPWALLKEKGKSRAKRTQSLVVSSVHIRCLGEKMCFKKKEESGADKWLEYQRNVSLALADKVLAKACTTAKCKSVKASNRVPAILMGDFNSRYRTTWTTLNLTNLVSPARDLANRNTGARNFVDARKDMHQDAAFDPEDEVGELCANEYATQNVDSRAVIWDYFFHNWPGSVAQSRVELVAMDVSRPSSDHRMIRSIVRFGERG
jgi:endonuclease/exonuclease/phosphatase family metal-dependent hydrolase